MRQRWSSALLLLGPVVVLVSLYLPWRVHSSGVGSSQDLDLAQTSFVRIDGWSPVGNVTALFALLLACVTFGSFAWPSIRRRVDEAWLGLSLAYFLLGVLFETRNEGRLRAVQDGLLGSGSGNLHFHTRYGTYVGLAGAALVLLGVALGARGAPLVRPPLRRLCAAALALGLLGVLLLPWQQTKWLPARSVRIGELGVAAPAGALAAVAAVGLLLAALARVPERRLEPAVLASVALLFTGAAFTVGPFAVHTGDAWLGLAVAAVAVLVVLADRSLLRRPERPTRYHGAVAIAGAALVASLFLPWQTSCYGRTADPNELGVAGSCVSTNGFGLAGSTVTLLALVLVLAIASPAVSRRVSRFELVAAVALLVVTLGLQLQTGTGYGVRLGIGYGAYVGFVAAALLAALVLAGSTWQPGAAGLTLRNLAPVLLGAVYLTAIVVPWWWSWNALHAVSWLSFVPRYAAMSWLSLGSVLLAIRLVHLWARRSRGSDRGPELVLLSLALVVLSVLDAPPFPTARFAWYGVLLLGASGALVLLAVIEERGGLRALRVPEVLRVDRI